MRFLAACISDVALSSYKHTRVYVNPRHTAVILATDWWKTHPRNDQFAFHILNISLDLAGDVQLMRAEYDTAEIGSKIFLRCGVRALRQRDIYNSERMRG